MSWRTQSYLEYSALGDDVTTKRYDKSGKNQVDGRSMFWKWTKAHHYGMDRHGDFSGLDSRDALRNADKLDYESVVWKTYMDSQKRPLQAYTDKDGNIVPTRNGAVCVVDADKWDQEDARMAEQDAKVAEIINLIQSHMERAMLVLSFDRKTYNQVMKSMTQDEYKQLPREIKEAFGWTGGTEGWEMAKYEAREGPVRNMAQAGQSTFLKGAQAKIACLVRARAAIELMRSGMTEKKAIREREFVPDDD